MATSAMPRISYDPTTHSWVASSSCVYDEPSCIGTTGTRIVIKPRDPVSPFTCLLTTASPAALQAQLDAKKRVSEYKARLAEDLNIERAIGSYVASCKPPVPRSSTSSSSWRSTSSGRGSTKKRPPKAKSSHASHPDVGLSQREIRDLQNRELGPEDYELLLRLDETVERRNVLSEEAAGKLVVSALESEAECSVCLTDMQTGESAVVLGCGHSFHPQCVREWLCKGRETCPMCNAIAHQ
jgi:hypothetical protein